ncbi:MAG: conjugal transfer protein [Subdoligranulum sp.]|nr:conjugal transfer protein [Subdoligranulum sp.]
MKETIKGPKSYIKQSEWIYCPICRNKTRTQIRPDTVLINFPLYCPKCKQESLIDVKSFQIIRRNAILNRS